MIRSLQGLRVLAMIGIFLFHAGLLLKGTFPVTFFFILSGFVIYYSYCDKTKVLNMYENVKWVLNRMKKLYPIHIITFFMSIVIRWNWIVKQELTALISNAIINLLLLQSVSGKIFTFNNLSWFLSTTFILYMFANPLIMIVNNLKKIKLVYIIILIIIMQNISIILNVEYNNPINLYANPIYRIFDFILGMITAKMFIIKKNKTEINKNYTYFEIISIVIFTIMYLITILTDLNVQYSLNYYSPMFIIIIYIFAFQRGSISNLLANNFCISIAGISFEFYMVHELILIVFRRVFVDIQYHWIIKNIIITIPSFLITFIIAFILNKYVTNKLFVKKLKILY